MPDQVAIAFTADVEDLKSGLAQAHGHMGRFTEVLQQHRMEMRQESGLARVLSRDLAALGLDAKGAGGEIAHLASAFAIGGALGGGVAVIKLLTTAASEFIESGVKTRETWAKALDSIHDLGKPLEEELHQLQLRAQGWTDTMLKGVEAMNKAKTIKTPEGELSGYEAQVVANTKIRELTRQIHGEAQEASVVLSSIPVIGAELAEADVTLRIARMKEELAAWKQVLVEANVEEKKIGTEAGNIDTEKARSAAKAERLKLDANIAEAMRQADIAASDKKFIEDMDREDKLAQWKIDAADRVFIHDFELQEAMTKAENEAADRKFEADYEREQTQLEKRRKAYEAFGHKIGDTFARAIEEGKSPAQAMANVLKEIEREIISAAVKFIVTKAAEAFAAAFVSQAAIPIVGPAEGAAQGAAAEATILGLLASLPSYDVGTPYVPFDQLAMVHRGERITTAADNQSGRGGGDPHLTVIATDARSFARAALDSGSELNESMRQLKRRYRSL